MSRLDTRVMSPIDVKQVAESLGSSDEYELRCAVVPVTFYDRIGLAPIVNTLI